MLACGWLGGNCLHFALQMENLTSLFYGDFFCFLYKVADSVARTKCKRPLLVRGNHWLPASKGETSKKRPGMFQTSYEKRMATKSKKEQSEAG